MSSLNRLTGQIIGDYMIGNYIGGGGMGEVYQGYPMENLNKPVAIKVLRPEYALDPDFRARFMREINLMEAMVHPNIIPIIEHGSTDKFLYFIMKLINGSTLFMLLRERRFSPATAWKIIQPIAAALEYVHSQGGVHRDVKPENVFVERDHDSYHVYLGDLGLGKKPDVDETLTRTGTAVGTPEYISPESALGDDLDQRADVYSLAVMTYELLLGVLPFKKRAPELTAVAHIREAPPPPMSRRPDFPLGVQEVILRGLEKNRENRYQSAQAFIEAYYNAVAALKPEQRKTEYWVRSNHE